MLPKEQSFDKIYKIVQHLNPPIEPCQPPNHHFIVAHLHCYDINKFNDFYGEYNSQIFKHCSAVVITYTINTNRANVIPTFNNATHTNICVICIPNKGMDIGAKIIASHYLEHTNITYKYILFLHSKTNVEKRKTYFQSLVCGLDQLCCIDNDDNKNVLGYFPPEIVNGDNTTYVINKNYINPTFVNEISHSSSIITLWREICEFLELDTSTIMFPEGNSFILKKCIVDELFQSQFYSLLNTELSFDMHWVYVYYKLNNIKQTPQNIYKVCREKNLCGNNLMRKARNRIKPHKTIAADHSDSQLEHIFERIVFNIIQKHCGEIHILPMPNIISDTYIFDVEQLNKAVNHFILKTTLPWYQLPNTNKLQHRSTPSVDVLQMPIYWINLDSNLERRYQMNLQLNAFKNKWFRDILPTRISAICGSTICTSNFALKSKFHTELQSFSQRVNRQSIFNNKPMTNNEIGCLLSHLLVMHTFLIDHPNKPYVIILEDDVNLISWESMRRLTQLDDFLNSSQSYECVQLSGVLSNVYKLPQATTKATKKQAAFVDWTTQLNNTNGQHPFWTTGAYILSRDACQKLLNIVKNYAIDYCIYPADWFIYMHIHTATMYPPLCCHHSYLKSNIRTNTGLQYKSNLTISKTFFKKNTVFLSTMYSRINDKEKKDVEYIKTWINTISHSIPSDSDVFIFGDQLPLELENSLPANILYFYLDFIQFSIHCNRTHLKLDPRIQYNSRFDLIFTRETVGSTHKWLAYLFSEYITSRKYKYYGTIIVGNVPSLFHKLVPFNISHVRHNLI
jgi:GR25 family glycosyltransferase involved in LPS biosynthesis